MSALGCNKDTACDALRELIEKGFIEPRIAGAYRVKFRRATEWRLNDRRCNVDGVQSQAFLKWRGPERDDPKQYDAEATKPGPRPEYRGRLGSGGGNGRETKTRRRPRLSDT